VRALACEAAWQGGRRSPAIKAFFERVMRDDPQREKIALLATAHYLIRVMVAMPRSGRLWTEGKASATKTRQGPDTAVAGKESEG